MDLLDMIFPVEIEIARPGQEVCSLIVLEDGGDQRSHGRTLSAVRSATTEAAGKRLGGREGGPVGPVWAIEEEPSLVPHTGILQEE